jgi:hypothetical protein
MQSNIEWRRQKEWKKMGDTEVSKLKGGSLKDEAEDKQERN